MENQPIYADTTDPGVEFDEHSPDEKWDEEEDDYNWKTDEDREEEEDGYA